MSTPSVQIPAIKCPKCKHTVDYGDVFINTLPESSKLTIGSATSVVIDPCGCSATSGDPDFRAMLQIIEVIANPDKMATLSN